MSQWYETAVYCIGLPRDPHAPFTEPPAGMYACAPTLSRTPALYVLFFEDTYHPLWLFAQKLLITVHVRGLLQFRHAMCTEPERNTFAPRETEELFCDTSGGKRTVATSFFVFYFLCVSYCSKALASFLRRGKKICVRSESVCHFAYINVLVHKHGSEVCAYRNLCTIANRADQFVGSLTQEYKIWHMVI